MTAIAIEPSRQKRAVEGRSHAGKVTGKLKAAIDYLAFDGRDEFRGAAAHAGLTAHAVRSALLKPHVKAYYQQQCEVLRTGAKGANIRRLCEIRDADDNMPAVQAIKALEQLGDEQHNRGAAPATPGLVVVINSGPAAVNADNVGVSWQSDRKGE